MTSRNLAWLPSLLGLLFCLMIPLPCPASSSCDDNPYLNYREVLKSAKLAYRSYRAQEKSFDVNELKTLCSNLQDKFAKLEFSTWQQGFANDKNIHPYILKSQNFRVLVSSLYRFHCQRHDTFMDLAAPLLHDPRAAEVFFDPKLWTDPALEEHLCSHEKELEEYERSLQELKNYILYENRKYAP